MAKYQIVEFFKSINGEGMRAGELAVFVRMKGCNLHCSYCDTFWANAEDVLCQEWTEEDICQKIRETGIRNVTLTGGEPLLQPDIEVLIRRLAWEKDLRLEIETNGSIEIERFRQMANPPVFTIDYKLPGSGMESQMCVENFCFMGSDDTIKFVVSGQEDLECANELIRKFDLSRRCHVILSPVFDQIEPVQIVEYMQEHCMNDVRMQLQLHKIIWSPEKRGV